MKQHYTHLKSCFWPPDEENLQWKSIIFICQQFCDRIFLLHFFIDLESMIMSGKDWFMNLMKLTDYSLLPLCQNNDVSNPVKLCTQVFFSFQKTKKKKWQCRSGILTSASIQPGLYIQTTNSYKNILLQKNRIKKIFFLSLINYKIQMYISFKIETSTYVLIMIKPQSVL